MRHFLNALQQLERFLIPLRGLGLCQCARGHLTIGVATEKRRNELESDRSPIHQELSQPLSAMVTLLGLARRAPRQIEKASLSHLAPGHDCPEHPKKWIQLSITGGSRSLRVARLQVLPPRLSYF